MPCACRWETGKTLGSRIYLKLISVGTSQGSGAVSEKESKIGLAVIWPIPNVLHIATECANKNHSAAFPEALPEWFIKLFTKEGDLVLDPFMGSVQVFVWQNG